MMNKSLQILLGLLLILVLAYVAFLDVSTKIKDDLLLKTKVMFSENNVRGVTANIQGDDLNISRTLVLTGTAISEVERVRIVTLSENIEGICRVDNQIRIHPAVPKAPKVPTVIKVPVVKASAVQSISKEVVSNKSTTATVVEKKELTSSSTATISTIPMVPVVEIKNIVVPTPVKAIAAPKVIEVEKIKLEGVK
jgi:hypothetical protein